jgi:hypothetical protein
MHNEHGHYHNSTVLCASASSLVSTLALIVTRPYPYISFYHFDLLLRVVDLDGSCLPPLTPNDYK